MADYNFSNTDLLQIYDLLNEAFFTSPSPLVVSQIIVPYFETFETVENVVIFDSSQGGILKSIFFNNNGTHDKTVFYKLNSNTIATFKLDKDAVVSASCIEGGTTFNSVFPFNGTFVQYLGNGTNVLTIECEIEHTGDKFSVYGERLQTLAPFV